MAEYQIRANAAAAHFRQSATIEAGQHDRAARMPGSGGNQAVEQFGVFDLVAPAQRLDDALDMAAAGQRQSVEVGSDRKSGSGASGSPRTPRLVGRSSSDPIRWRPRADPGQKQDTGDRIMLEKRD
jgi:hypothetical protein